MTQALFSYRVEDGPHAGAIMDVIPDEFASYGGDRYAEELCLSGRLIFGDHSKFSHLDNSDQLTTLTSLELISLGRMMEDADFVDCVRVAVNENLDWEECRDAAKAVEGAVILPVYCYDHSGICFNTTGFSCPWDSGLAGVIVMEAETIEADFGGDKARATAALKADVELFSQWANGEVFCVGVREEDGDTEYSRQFFGTDWDTNGALDHLFGDAKTDLSSIH
jgi:hypothetical protein